MTDSDRAGEGSTRSRRQASPDIKDHYVSPYELGHGRFVPVEHDFARRDELKEAADMVRRTKAPLLPSHSEGA
ncbi:hypothetical protein [Streptomyces sp. NBC_00878]|uniref:hypothetical protein n=1 Tax=Streptomyces sp. NBC_00878 TaxID=2975854 RepID=UPI00225C34F3|nr:hypothetical protein [Streptomyces sp. NBC_00878]MCX4911156.1 hypothetical protein [Streptomyces sp. NBC_00878]